MKGFKKFYLKERISPVFGKHFVLCGKLSRAEAERRGNPLFGKNIMHGFDSQQAYTDRITELKKEGHKFL